MAMQMQNLTSYASRPLIKEDLFLPEGNFRQYLSEMAYSSMHGNFDK